MRTRPLVALAAAVLLLAASPGAEAARRSGPPKPGLGRPVDPGALPFAHRGRWITDAYGRVVTLHGVNMVDKLPPYDPSALGFGPDDANFLAAQGFNSVRLGLIYKRVEPTPGHYDDAYLDRIASIAHMLGRRGLHVLIDFHQDLFNERFNGEGFPDWAVMDDGLPAQPDAGFPGNYFVMPAEWRAWDHFWANDPGPNGVGLQDAFGAAWRHAAARFARERAVFGYDVFNEPWAGTTWPTCLNPAGCPLFDATVGAFFTKVFRAVRQADPRAIVYYEPHSIFAGGADVNIPDTGDANAGFSFHVYCLGALFGGSALPEQVNCPLGEDRPFDRAEAQASRNGDTLLMTEFGATDDLPTVTRDVTAADRHMDSWEYWTYVGGDPSGQRPSEGIVIDPSKPPTGDNVKQAKLDVLVRPYPRAVAGTPVSWSYDTTSGRFDFAFTADPAIRAPTEIFVPYRHFPKGYVVTVTGPAVVTSATGATILTLRSTGAGAVTVAVVPA